MKLLVKPSTVDGTIPSSPSKSYTHRAMVLAQLANGTSTLRRVLLSGDTIATLRAIQLLGAEVTVTGDICTVKGGEFVCPEDVIDVENSGTTIRLIAGVASLLPCITILTGDESIRQRPMQPLIDALTEMGVYCVSTRGDGRAPLVIRGPNHGKVAHIRGDVSSQFISSLLISSPLKEVDTDIILTTPLKSRPYVEITIEMMKRFGGECYESREGFHVPGDQEYKPCDYTIPGDYSSAAFPLVAGALAGTVTVTGLDLGDRQGDKLILDILEQFGAYVERQPSKVTVSAGELKGIDIDMSNSPDLFPIVSVLAAVAKGETNLYNAEHVRLKESDRISTTVSFLRSMGAHIDERRDGCLIRGPNKLRGAVINSHSDHRILMAAAIAGLVADGETIITDGKCYEVSYPSFINDMRALGASMELIE
ncbi:MAG: 3-phosphoshikimate 1-carboxyvinyltransferase [Methanomassiliicoccales archaeon]|jgi:3-phosphoshikimate 1-carboxyvinyltransferase|nr:3-phosphoshikimate 1-carboxyvinyltransferase [Methanomassiliicoccales archaeon]